MSMGLDLGSSGFRSLRTGSGEMRGRSCRAVYTLMPDTPAQRRMLDQSGISWGTCGGNLVLLGDGAVEWASLLRTPLIPMLSGGRIPQGNPLCRQLLTVLVETMLPTPLYQGEFCCMTIPANGGSAGSFDSPEMSFFTGIVRNRGYSPIVLNQALSLMLAEMGDLSFSGVTVVFGAAVTEFCLAHCGREIARVVIPRGGDWIDQRLAESSEHFTMDSYGQRVPDTEFARTQKHQFADSLNMHLHPGTREMLPRLYGEFLRQVFSEAAMHMAQIPQLRRLPQPAMLAFAGGASRIPGFGDLLQQVLREIDLPIALRGLRRADANPFAIARGCLIHAELETQAVSRRAG